MYVSTELDFTLLLASPHYCIWTFKLNYITFSLYFSSHLPSTLSLWQIHNVKALYQFLHLFNFLQSTFIHKQYWTLLQFSIIHTQFYPQFPTLAFILLISFINKLKTHYGIPHTGLTPLCNLKLHPLLHWATSTH